VLTIHAGHARCRSACDERAWFFTRCDVDLHADRKAHHGQKRTQQHYDGSGGGLHVSSYSRSVAQVGKTGGVTR